MCLVPMSPQDSLQGQWKGLTLANTALQPTLYFINFEDAPLIIRFAYKCQVKSAMWGKHKSCLTVYRESSFITLKPLAVLVVYAIFEHGVKITAKFNQTIQGNMHLHASQNFYQEMITNTW